MVGWHGGHCGPRSDCSDHSGPGSNSETRSGRNNTPQRAPPTNLLFLLGPSYWCFSNFPNYYQSVEDQVCRAYPKPNSIHLSIQNGD